MINVSLLSKVSENKNNFQNILLCFFFYIFISTKYFQIYFLFSKISHQFIYLLLKLCDFCCYDNLSFIDFIIDDCTMDKKNLYIDNEIIIFLIYTCTTDKILYIVYTFVLLILNASHSCRPFIGFDRSVLGTEQILSRLYFVTYQPFVRVYIIHAIFVDQKIPML